MTGRKPLSRKQVEAARAAAEKLAAEQTLEAARRVFEAVKAARKRLPDPPT